MNEQIIISALYKFTPLPDYVAIQPRLQQRCVDNGVRGTLLLAAEGINGTIAGSRSGIDAVIAYLREDPRFADLKTKESTADFIPFHRMKVRLKNEIVTIGLAEVDPLTTVGTYVPPTEWNELINDPEILLIDTRNKYEVKVGTFSGALDPQTDSFRDFPNFVSQNLDPQKHKKIAMFCTGGIRCEKATSYLLEQGFSEVYHLQGGILKYLEQVPTDDSQWEGECFVFDNRVTVNHDLARGTYDLCHACRTPLTTEELNSPAYVKGISCQYCIDLLSEEKKIRLAERQKQVELAAERGERHIGS